MPPITIHFVNGGHIVFANSGSFRPSWDTASLAAYYAEHATLVAKMASPEMPMNQSPAKGISLAVSPLPGSPSQIREANHLMLTQGYCYLRHFAVKYRWPIAQYLGNNPFAATIQQQLGIQGVFRRHDKFVALSISGSFQGHIAKSTGKSLWCFGTLARWAEGFPIRIGAAPMGSSGHSSIVSSRSSTPAPAADVTITDVVVY